MFMKVTTPDSILVKDYIETVGDDDNIDPVFFYKFDKKYN